MADPKRQTQLLASWAGLGADRAALCLGQLTGCRLRARPVEPGRRVSRESGPWETGLFFEVEGGLAGVVGLMLAPGSREALVRALLGEGHEPEAAESALRELGNIVASQAISAIAQEIGERLLPSVPVLAWRGAESALAAQVRRRGLGPDAHRFECLLDGGGRGPRLCFVLVTDGALAKPDGDPARGV